MLNGVAGFVRGDPQGRDRWRVVNVRRKAKAFIGRIVMVAEVIVRFDDFDIMNLGRLENLAGRLRPGECLKSRAPRPTFGRRC